MIALKPPKEFKEFLVWLRGEYAKTYRDCRKARIRKSLVGEIGVNHGTKQSKEDPQGPTDCLPGTWGKIEILEDRARRGVALFHHLDAVPNKDRREEGR